ncbi:MAG TPA: cyclic nucleotide-binding domain-containing protein, partial [Acidimicrobiales bacterium]
MAANRFTRDQRITLLKGVGLFSDCSREELRRISSLITPITVDKGAVLTLQGQPGSEFFIVVSGTAIAAGNERELAQYGPGS